MRSLIDVVGEVKSNISNLLIDQEVSKVLKALIAKNVGNIKYDDTKKTIIYIDSGGKEQPFRFDQTLGKGTNVGVLK